MWRYRPDINEIAFSFAEDIFEPFYGEKICPSCKNPDLYSSEVLNTCLKCGNKFRESIEKNSLYCSNCEF